MRKQPSEQRNYSPQGCPSLRMDPGPTQAQSATLSAGSGGCSGRVTRYQQDVYDVECVAIARGPKTAALRPLAHEHITICTDAQAAVRRMGLDELGPGQRNAL